MQRTKLLCTSAGFVTVVLGIPAAGSGATIQGQWIDQMGSIEVGGMQFNGADDIVSTITGAGEQCESLTRLETLPSSLLATCDPDEQRYRLLPDADGEPLVAPLQ